MAASLSEAHRRGHRSRCPRCASITFHSVFLPQVRHGLLEPPLPARTHGDLLTHICRRVIHPCSDCDLDCPGEREEEALCSGADAARRSRWLAVSLYTAGWFHCRGAKDQCLCCSLLPPARAGRCGGLLLLGVAELSRRPPRLAWDIPAARN